MAFSFASNAQVVLRYGDEPVKGWGEASSVVTPYVSFPSEFTAPYVGNAITSVKIAVMEEGTNCYLYIKNKPDDQQYIYRQKLESLKPGWNEITLDTPFSIPDKESIAIGYKASFAEAGGVGISDDKFPDADKVYYNSQNRWTSTDGAICIQAVVSGDNMPLNEMLISSLKEDSDEVSSSHAYIGYVRNVGNNYIDTYTLTVKLDDEEVQTIEGTALAINEEGVFSFEILCDVEGTHTVTVEISSVNGTNDYYAANNLASATFTNQGASLTRRIVCEEYTGTWCGFCPRGMVGLELMRQQYGDLFIPIAVHGGDPMEIEDEAVSYQPYIDSCTGAPFCNVNRQYTGDPFADIKTMCDLAAKLTSHIGVEATCDWNEDMTAIDITTTYYSDIDIENPSFNIAYTVTESGITGYPQTNYYAGGRNGEMYGWEDKTDPTMDVTFNDVARAIIGGYAGMECRYEPMEAFTPYTHSYSIPLPENVTSLSQIKVIPQIIDATTGSILNATEVIPASAGVEQVNLLAASVKVSRENGMVTVKSSNEELLRVAVYSITGEQVVSKQFNGDVGINVPQGIYIVVVGNSSAVINRTKIIL